jgi:hypothetical protein
MEKYGKHGFEELRKNLVSLREWFDIWQMKFNIDECKVMHFVVKKSSNPEAETKRIV